MKTPFGIIYSKDLNPLLNKEDLRNGENMIDVNRDSKKNVYASESMNEDKLRSEKPNKIIKWNKLTQLLMIILIISSFFTLF